MNKRSWLIDTAETKEDKKNLPKDLKNLDSAINWASRSPRKTGGTVKNTPGAANVNKLYRQGN